MNFINPARKCSLCGEICTAEQLYCTLRCRDRAKRLRRKNGEQKLPTERRNEAAKPRAAFPPYPDATDETLGIVAEMMLAGEIAPPALFLGAAARSAPWAPALGIAWDVLSDGTGRMTKIL